MSTVSRLAVMARRRWCLLPQTGFSFFVESAAEQTKLRYRGSSEFDVIHPFERLLVTHDMSSVSWRLHADPEVPPLVPIRTWHEIDLRDLDGDDTRYLLRRFGLFCKRVWN